MVPIVEVAGGARERGRAHGETLREKVGQTVDEWRNRVRSAPAEDGASYLSSAETWTPEAVEELRGIAEGAGIPFGVVFEINLADERRVFGCSSAGLPLGAGGVPVSGQTMDTPEWFAPLRVAFRSSEGETGLTSLALTIAGMPALCGVNSDGIAVWCNALYALTTSSDGVPVTCIVRRLLSSRTLAEARDFVERVPHASGQHYLLASPEGVVSLECSARSVVETPARGAAVWHANHAVADPDRADPSSLARDAFMADAVTAAGSAADLCAMLEDTTVPVCKTGNCRADGYRLWAAVAEHRTPPSVLVSPGPPRPGSWEHVQL